MYQWQKITDKAAFAARDGAGALTFNDKMWLLGGWNPDDKVNFPRICNSEIWSSTDGADWKLEGTAAWEPRHCFGFMVFKDRMWVIGGDTSQKYHQHDIWSSADGVNWELVCETPAWAPRIMHYSCVHDGKLWVMGGQTLLKHASDAPELNYNDVWSSEDGVNWVQVAESTPWEPRGMIGGSCVLNGRMWLLSGGTFENPRERIRKMYREVWSSADGKEWKQHKTPPWLNRQFHEVAVFDDKMWILEGTRFNYDLWPDGMGPLGGNLRDVWWSEDGEEWHEVPDTPWPHRHAASVFVYDDALWMVAGNNMQPDVWKMTKS